jgi:hypothetical protein
MYWNFVAIDGIIKNKLINGHANHMEHVEHIRKTIQGNRTEMIHSRDVFVFVECTWNRKRD